MYLTFFFYFRKIWCSYILWGGKMRLKSRKNKRKPLIIVLVFLIIAAILSGICFFKMQPLIFKIAHSNAETIMLNSANEAVLKILEENNITYSDIACLSSNDDGYVTSLEIDVYKVNFLKSKIANEVSRLVDSKDYYDVRIPIGTFLGNTYTAGFGPKLYFKMQLTSTAFVDFKHEFKSAGINQVLHIITVEIKTKGSLIVAGYNKGIETKTSAIAAQTVIVGKSPDAFTNVVESQTDNTGGLINDYGAIVE